MKNKVRGLSKITFALRVGRWSEKRVVYYIKVQTRDVPGQKMPKNGNVICESSLTNTATMEGHQRRKQMV